MDPSDLISDMSVEREAPYRKGVNKSEQVEEGERQGARENWEEGTYYKHYTCQLAHLNIAGLMMQQV